MSFYKNKLFDPKSKEPFRVSRSKIDLFLECPRCFYLDRRLGVARPPGFPFTLNVAVDTLLKKEFDIHRARGKPHPLMKKYKIDALPVDHIKLQEWRENFVGVQHVHEPSNLLVTGAIDDLWQTLSGEYIVVDYKATSKTGEVTLDAAWQDGYKRQMEVYQWLLRQNGLPVTSVGYFVYCNAHTDKKAFDGQLEFEIKPIPYTGNDTWVEPVLLKIRQCLMKSIIPSAGVGCEYCQYHEKRISFA